mgnify:CR=1 FL=1
MDQQQENHLNYDDICRIIGDIYLKSFETLKKQNKEADSLRLALQNVRLFEFYTPQTFSLPIYFKI